MTKPHGHRREMKLEAHNPSPFVQPFLLIHFENSDVNGNSGMWYVDVEGKIDLYLDPDTFDWKRKNGLLTSTKLLRDIIQEFESVGRVIGMVSIYVGSGGPTHMIRNGALFRRVYIDDPASVIAKKTGTTYYKNRHMSGLCHIPNVHPETPMEVLDRHPAGCRCCGMDLDIINVTVSKKHPLGRTFFCRFC